jgi:glyoxylase-like metal-dependent hydrolase (beta-lactamase superfamily II)
VTDIQLAAADGVHRVEDAYVNWYLVEEDGRLTVVDAGHPRSWSSLAEVLRRIRRTTSDIEALVLTHGHFDHMGFVRRAQGELGIPVLAHERELPVVSHPWRYDHERSRLPYLARYSGFRRAFAAMGAAGALWVRGTDEVTTYASGERLDAPGRPLVLATHGHTHGHCSLQLPERGTVIAGDALVTFNPYTGGHGPQIVSGAATADSAEALAALDALAGTGAETLLPGHGRPWTEGAAAAVERARAAGPS